MHHRTRTLRAALLAVSAVLVLGVTAGCSLSIGSNNHGHTTDQTGNGGMMDPSGDANAADVMFVQMMIPHHEQAVEMSELAPDRAGDPRVLDLASRIAAAQAPEITQMQAMLDRWDVPQMMDHSGHDMPMAGMAGDEELASLKASSGAEFDRQFLELMIEHHQGAVDMAEDALRDGADPELRILLDEIIMAQKAEITEMQSMLGDAPAN